LKRIKIESKVPEDKQKDTLVKLIKADNASQTIETGGTYFIIAGSFANTENARLAAEKYRSQGYKTSIISMTGKNGIKAKLVSIKSFNNPGEAARFLNEFKSKIDHEAWIYSSK
jgi:cell division septation protein DedD